MKDWGKLKKKCATKESTVMFLSGSKDRGRPSEEDLGDVG